METWPLLSVVTFAPLIGALLILVMVRGDREATDRNARWLALWASLATFLISLLIWINFDTGTADFQYVEQVAWFKFPGGYTLNYHMGVDGISMMFVLLSTALTPICILCSWAVTKRVREFMAAFLVLETFMVGTFCALDLVTFYVFFEGVLLPMFLMDFGVVIVGFYRPLLPILAADVFHVGPGALGVLFAAPAVGSVLGSSTLLLLGEVKRKGVLFLVSVLMSAASLALLGVSSWYWMALLAAGALGYTDSLSVVVRTTLTQTLAPDRLRGRAASYSNSFAILGNALGSMEAGFVAGAIGAGGTLLLGGAVAAGVVVAGGLKWRDVWRYRSEGSP